MASGGVSVFRSWHHCDGRPFCDGPAETSLAGHRGLAPVGRERRPDFLASFCRQRFDDETERARLGRASGA
jgi:hypothetical protein